jgi:hypothetical protein
VQLAQAAGISGWIIDAVESLLLDPIELPGKYSRTSGNLLIPIKARRAPLVSATKARRSPIRTLVVASPL